MRFILPVMLFLFISCAGAGNGYAPVHEGAFFRTNWPSYDFNNKIDGRSSFRRRKKGDNSQYHNLRRQMVSMALKLPGSSIKTNDFGYVDTLGILKKIAVKSVSIFKNRDAFIKTAEKCGAYMAGKAAEKGDIVLFNNQFDRNGNGVQDDWYTGVGIVIDVDGKKIKAITRTGHMAKEVVLWPNGPMVHEYRGEVVNSFVKIPDRSDSPDAEYLAGQLYAGVIDVEVLFSDCLK
jgi:hypothetical protein